MRKFFTSATAFYMLSDGEVLSKSDINFDFNRMYIIWPKSGLWKVRHKWHRGWEEISMVDFESENDAFNFAYEHFLKT